MGAMICADAAVAAVVDERFHITGLAQPGCGHQ